MKNATGPLITLAVVGAAAWALYEWLSSQCATPGSDMYGGFICGILPGAVAAPASTSTTSAPAGPAVAAATTAILNNVSRPGMPFQAGDTFQLVVTGPPNSAVMGTGQQNANAPSTTNFGTTNAAGQFVLPGTYDTSNVGVWTESWQVGSATPAPLNFTISAAPGVSGLGQYSNRLPVGVFHRGRFA